MAETWITLLPIGTAWTDVPAQERWTSPPPITLGLGDQERCICPRTHRRTARGSSTGRRTGIVLLIRMGVRLVRHEGAAADVAALVSGGPGWRGRLNRTCRLRAVARRKPAGARAAIPRLVFAAFTNVFAWMGFSSLSIRWMSVPEGILLVFTMPIWATLFAWPLAALLGACWCRSVAQWPGLLYRQRCRAWCCLCFERCHAVRSWPGSQRRSAALTAGRRGCMASRLGVPTDAGTWVAVRAAGTFGIDADRTRHVHLHGGHRDGGLLPDLVCDVASASSRDRLRGHSARSIDWDCIIGTSHRGAARCERTDGRRAHTRRRHARSNRITSTPLSIAARETNRGHFQLGVFGVLRRDTVCRGKAHTRTH